MTKQPTLAELTDDVAEFKFQVAEALRDGGENSRPHRAAVANLAVAERKLNAAKHVEGEKARLSNLNPDEIVDELERRR